VPTYRRRDTYLFRVRGRRCREDSPKREPDLLERGFSDVRQQKVWGVEWNGITVESHACCADLRVETRPIAPRHSNKVPEVLAHPLADVALGSPSHHRLGEPLAAPAREVCFLESYYQSSCCVV
jgi:hypothetical protein